MATAAIRTFAGASVSSAVAIGGAATLGFEGPLLGVGIAAAACLLPASALFAAGAVGLPVMRMGAVIALTFARPLLGLAAVIACDRFRPDLRGSLIVGLACVYPTCLALETLFLLRLTGAAPGRRVRPRSITETHNDG